MIDLDTMLERNKLSMELLDQRIGANELMILIFEAGESNEKIQSIYQRHMKSLGEKIRMLRTETEVEEG